MNEPTAGDAAPAPTRIEPTASGAGRSGPGPVIREARERAQLSLEDLAARTRLARATLEALETDDFGALSETVYVRGYYRKCGKALGLSEDDLLQRYEAAGGPRQAPPPTKLLLAGGGGEAIARPRSGGSSSWLWLIALVVGVLLAVFALWRARGTLTKNAAAPPSAVVVPAPPPTATEAPSPSGSMAASAAMASPGAVAPATVPPAATSNAGVASAAGLTPSAGVAPADDRATARANAAAAQATGKPVPAPANGDLALTFTGSSWVQVKDATGKMLLNGMVEAGDTQVVAGRPPYTLDLGNAPAVEVHFHGGLVDFKSHIRKNQTAHLQVPES